MTIEQGKTTIKNAESDLEIDACFPVMALLRPHLERSVFVALVTRMIGQGYRLGYVTSGGSVRAVVGYRIVEMLRTGPMLEIDDLVSDSSDRSKGYGKQLLDWCFEQARINKCSVVELDSAVGRADAHRFYFRERMHVLGLHFSRPVA